MVHRALHHAALDGDSRAQGTSDPTSPFKMDFLARRAEALGALARAPDYAEGLVEAGAVAEGAGAAETERPPLASSPFLRARYFSGRHRTATGGLVSSFSRSRVSLFHSWSGSPAPTVAQFIICFRNGRFDSLPRRSSTANMISLGGRLSSFRTRRTFVSAMPTALMAWLVWILPLENPMHRALRSGAGLRDGGRSADHAAIVSGDGRCSVVACARFVIFDGASARGIRIGVEALTTFGRAVRARFTSVPLRAGKNVPDIPGAPPGHISYI